LFRAVPSNGACANDPALGGTLPTSVTGRSLFIVLAREVRAIGT
jgi:hypothetical protein